MVRVYLELRCFGHGGEEYHVLAFSRFGFDGLFDAY
jgi:hypothetical protein